VVVEEQTPTPDRQVSVRMTAQLKPAESRKALVAETPAPKPERGAAGDKEPKQAGTPGASTNSAPPTHRETTKPT
ncbi:MAG: hypothetical protein ACRD5L_08050, partial [Bryobacteraceae bacterium]